MDRIEFLDILRDYLKGKFSVGEIDDIIRDYEEYFLDGTIEGKSDIEIIESLGSPKNIANQLIEETKNKNKKDINSMKLERLKSNIKREYKKCKNYISNKLTTNIKDKDHKKSRKAIDLSLNVLSFLVFIPTFIIYTCFVVIGILLASLVAVYIATMPILIKFVSGTPEIAGIYIFASIAFVGGQILTWQIYVLLLSTFRLFRGKYKNWIKTRRLYIDASKKKEEKEKGFEDLKEGDEEYEEH